MTTHRISSLNELQGEEILADPEVHEHEGDSGEGAGCVRPQHDPLQGFVQSGGKEIFQESFFWHDFLAYFLYLGSKLFCP